MKSLQSKILLPLLGAALFSLSAVSPVFSAPAINSGSPNCPFPHNMVYGFGLQPSRYSQAQYAAAVSQFYVSWYNDFVVTSSGGVTAKVIWPDAGTLGFGANDETVSEGIGYGMLIAVQMADKTLFDGLNNFYHANLDGKGLMNWQCEIALGSYTGCTGNNATDADQDVCMALYMAVSQWGGTTYLTQANSIAASLISYDFEANGTTMVSGGDSNQGYVYPDYCAPGWYRCFESKTGNVAWTGAVNWVYNTLCPQLEGTWTHGFVPNRVSATALTSAQAISPEGPDNHGYDASRWGWRMGTDYLWNGSNQAPMSLFAAQIYTGVSTNGYLNYIQEYWNALDGNTATKAGTDGASSPCSHLQIGPALVGCMAGLPKNPVNQSFVDDTYDELYNRLLANSGCATMEYFQDTLGLMCLMTSTGNFPNMACNGCAAGTAPPTPTPIPCFRLDELENDSLNNSTNGYWFTFAYASVNNTPVNPTPTRSISSGVSYILQAPGDVSPYAAAVSGFWEDNGTVTVSGGVTSNIYGGFAIATQLDPPYTNLQNLSVGGAGPCSLLDISFFVKATQAMTMRLNFYNPAIDPANGGNANQFGYTFPVSTVWQGVTVTYNQIMCQDWNNAGFCYGLAKNGTVSLTRSQALTNVTSIQWDTAGNPATLGYEVDDVCMHFVQVSNGYFTPVVISTATPLPTATNTPGAATNTFTTTPSATRTNTATNTATFTMTSTRTNTATNSPTPTATNTVANTATFTPTPTRTNTATSTLTPTGTNTPANTATNTATSTATSTRTNTPANTATNTSTNTVANTPTNTSTNSSTSTATFTRTNTATNTATFTSTLADTATDTSTATVTPTRTATSTPTNTATVTDTLTATSTATSTSTATRTNTPTSSFTPTITDTATITSTPTSTTTGTQPPTSTPTNTATVTDSFTATHTATNTGTSTATLTPTSTPTSTHTPTNTTTQTATSTATNTLANTATPTSTATNTLVNTATVTNTLTNTASNTPTLTPTNTATSTTTSTATSTPTVTDTATITSTPTNTQTGTQPPTSTPTNTATKTNTLTATMTIMNTSTFTTTRTATPTATYTPTNSLTNTATPSATDTLVDTATPTSTWVTVNASAGNNPPGVSTQLPGVTNVPVQQILLTNPSGSPVTMIEIMVGISGNGNLSGITNLTLYSNGVSVTSTTAITSGGMATFFLSNNDILAGGGSVTYMIQADFNSAASGQYTFTMTGGTGSNGQPIMINFVGGLSGVPGATVFIEAATATPTTTASTTPTSSPTAIANTTPVVFPNPSTGDPVVLSVDTSQAVNSVDVSVYTTAFRRVQHQTAQPNGGTVIASTVSSGSKNWKIQLVMKDDKDNELASGLYYVVVSTPNSRQVIKLLLLR